MGERLQRKFRPVVLAFLLTALVVMADLYTPVYALFDRTPPRISIWYGSRQTFGKPGLAQRWVNVLGNASDPESGIHRLTYRLNGGQAVELSVGPDERRLNAPGDFNVDLDPAALRSGENTLRIEAVNDRGLITTSTVTVVYAPGQAALPYEINWARVGNAQDVLQIVDGKWRWDASGIRPVEPGYDRMLAVGDASWTNYQVTVPVTINGFDTGAFDQQSGGEHAGVSIDLRWIGHSNDPPRCRQPLCGWNPVGNFNKYFFMPDGQRYVGLKVKEKEAGFPTLRYEMPAGHTFLFKASVQTTPQGNRYRLKVWERGVEPEPEGWLLESTAPPGNPSHGAFALVAHHSDVTFGDIRVEPLPGQ